MENVHPPVGRLSRVGKKTTNETRWYKERRGILEVNGGAIYLEQPASGLHRGIAAPRWTESV